MLLSKLIKWRLNCVSSFFRRKPREPTHRIPEGCRGVAGEISSVADEDYCLAHFGVKLVTGFSCPGLDGMRELNPKNYRWSDGNTDRPYVVDRHTREAAVYIAAACAECQLGPAAQLRREAALSTSFLDELNKQSEILDKQIELARLQREIGQQATPQVMGIEAASPPIAEG